MSGNRTCLFVLLPLLHSPLDFSQRVGGAVERKLARSGRWCSCFCYCCAHVPPPSRNIAADDAQLPPAVLRTCAANLRSLLTPGGASLADALRRVAEAQTHADCVAALRLLQAVASTCSGARALAAAGCVQSWSRWAAIRDEGDWDLELVQSVLHHSDSSISHT